MIKMVACASQNKDNNMVTNNIMKKKTTSMLEELPSDSCTKSFLLLALFSR